MSTSQFIKDAQEKVDQVAALLAQGQVLDQEDIDNINRMIQMTGKLRNSMVQYALKCGMRGKEVAKIYGLSQARVSQIKRGLT